jgi:hypothetical protein
VSPARRERHRPPATSPLTGTGGTRLKPDVEQLRVGNDTAAPRAEPPPAPKPKPRAPFGTYLPPDLQREFKARCVLLGIEMQDGVEQAIRAWLDENPA